MNKNIIRIIISIISGILMSLLSLVVVISDKCAVGQDTCGSSVGFPFSVFSGPSYIRSFKDYEVLALNTVFWVLLSMAVFLLFIPLARKLSSKNKDKQNRNA
ncbi:MAG: hypothetical protein WCK26_02650 [Candidatus Saccharibacteria bacterium]